MTQEDKELLLKDLCGRLPYGVIIQEYNEEYGYTNNALNTIDIEYFSIHEPSIEGTWINRIENVKLYLRPMSSMTDEEISDLQKINSQFSYCKFDNVAYVGAADDGFCSVEDMDKILDYLNSKHFDYRGLIPKGLALKAPEGMYNF